MRCTAPTRCRIAKWLNPLRSGLCPRETDQETDNNGIESGHPRHGFRRIGLCRAQRGAGAGQARLPDSRCGAAAGTGLPSAAAGPGRPDPRRAGQSALSGLGRGRDAGFARRHQPGRHSGRDRRPEIRRGAGGGCRRRGQGGCRRRRPDGACLGDRRRRGFAVGLWPFQGRGREGGAFGRPLGHHPAAVGRVRARGSVHQPLCGARDHLAGAAADRRRR